MIFFPIFSSALLAAGVSSHSIFQKVSVNGADQGQLKGVRAPQSDNPIQNVYDAAFACNKDIVFKDNNIITIPAGARVGAWWGHVIGGAQYPNDPDQPIASSHKGQFWCKRNMQTQGLTKTGPIQYYLAKVNNAATTGTTGLQWFKVAHDGLSNGAWAVDTMIKNGGWHYFNMVSDRICTRECLNECANFNPSQPALPLATISCVLSCSLCTVLASLDKLNSTWSALRSVSLVAVQTRARTLYRSRARISLTTQES
jgi:hypothetical protein